MKLNGYRASHRNKWFLITQKILTPQEFLLFEYYLDLMAFDKSHKDKFGLFEAFLDEIAVIFNKTKDTVRIWHNGLLKKGFIKTVDQKRQLYTFKSPSRYVIGLAQWGGEATKYAKEEKNQTNKFILENLRFFQPETENIQPKKDKLALNSKISTKNSLSSSKNDSIVSPSISSKKVVIIQQKVRSDEEYQKIYDEGGFIVLTPDDMKWIDKNVFEKRTIDHSSISKN